MFKRNGLILILFLASGLMGIELKLVSTLRAPGGPITGDKFGIKVAPAGDINKDGYNDLIICADGKFSEDPKYTGKVYVYLGGRKLIENPALILSGEKGGDHFGSSAHGTGDINEDGYDDFAVGADNSNSIAVDAGRVYIFYGGRTLDTIPDIVLDGNKSNEWFGASLTGGMDINGDGKPDFVIGAPYGGKGSTGAAYVYLGGMGYDKPSLTLYGEKPVDAYGVEVNMLGDLNEDKIAEFSVSAIYYDVGDVKDAGRVYIYKGGSIISKTPFVTYDGKVNGEHLGYSVYSTGDITDDGFNDVIVGGPGGGPGGLGNTYLFAGGEVLRPDFVKRYMGNSVNDLFGNSVSNAGDINGDGINDIMIGAPYTDVGAYHTGKVSFYAGGTDKSISEIYFITGAKENSQCGYYITLIEGFFGKGKDAYVVSSAGPGSGREGKGYVQIYIK